MKWLKSIFSSGNMLENVSSGIDKAVFTKEERSDVFERLLPLYHPFKMAQRFLSLIFCIPFALGWTACFVMFLLGVDVSQNALEMLKGDMAIIVGIIVAFYFGGGAIEGILRTK